MRIARSRLSLATLAVGVALVSAPPAAAQDPQNPICLKQGEETPEIYGPTDIGATLANKRLSVAVNAEGTLSVLRWPTRSYSEQLKYFTIDRDEPRLGLNPNEGAFSGLVLRLKDDSKQLMWLRDLAARQRYASHDSDTVRTRYRSAELGLRLEVADIVPRSGDSLLRRHILRLKRTSPVARARLVTFANLNPTTERLPLVPVADWCKEVRGADQASYDEGADAIVWRASDFDQVAGRQRSVAIAMGTDRRSRQHHIGADSYTEFPGTQAGPQSAFDDAADGRLSGNGSGGPTELDSALLSRLRPARPVTQIFSFGRSDVEATAELEEARSLSARREVRRKRRYYLRWTRDAPLPAEAPPALERLARRSLVSLNQAIEHKAAPGGDGIAVVASLSTQSPYYVDWIRDGAFFNEALDIAGHPRLVERHNRFYVETQHTLEEGAPPGTPLTTCASPTPDGNWFMTNWIDGGDAGTFPWEIDETGFGLWALYRHAQFLEGEKRTAYLEEVYPALRRTAEFLVAFRDPLTKLPPGMACEDDNPPTPDPATMHSSGPVLLAMRSAERAARELGRTVDAERYAARVAELEQAIDSTYNVDGGAWTGGFGDGGWALWPVRVKPYAHPRSQRQGEVAWQRVKPSFQAPDGPKVRGQYEVKALHGLAHLYRATNPELMGRVKRGLRWISEVQAAYQGTGILGESWYVRDGEVISVVAQPHVWEQALVYLAALKAYGKSDYEPARRDRLMKPQRGSRR